MKKAYLHDKMEQQERLEHELHLSLPMMRGEDTIVVTHAPGFLRPTTSPGENANSDNDADQEEGGYLNCCLLSTRQYGRLRPCKEASSFCMLLESLKLSAIVVLVAHQRLMLRTLMLRGSGSRACGDSQPNQATAQSLVWIRHAISWYEGRETCCCGF